MLIDSFGRKIDYLRLSVTDRCNFRCVYCLPEIFNRFTPSEENLTDDEIGLLVSQFAELGISKIRITGGEPLLRPRLAKLIQRIKSLNSISDIALSTNGYLLPKYASDLKKAGVTRVNISLDSLNADKFQQITRFGSLNEVKAGLEAAEKAQLNPIKINVVVARGMNEDEISDFVTLTETSPLHVRFIELMPMGETGFFTKNKWVPVEEIIERASPIEALPNDDWPKGYGPAKYYKRPGAKGTVGIISALSCGFCSSCNRIRLSSKGMLYPCLDNQQGYDLKSLVRSGVSSADIKKLILKTIDEKPKEHDMVGRASVQSSNPRFMCMVGG